MNPRFFSAEEIHGLVETRELIAVLKQEFASLAAGKARNSPRMVLPLENGRALGAMLASGDGGRLLGAKLVCVFPANRKLELNPHQGVVALFHPETGQPLALFGSGLQAYSHALAIAQVRTLEKITIWGRTLAGARQLAERLERELKIPVIPTKDVLKAGRDAQILALCTPATEIYLRAQDLPSGAHVNAIGACRPGMRELEIPLKTSAKLFIDDLERIKEEAEEMQDFFAKQQTERLTEIGNVFSGAEAGRSSEAEVTIFKSVGLGIQDAATAALAYRKSWQGADL